MNRDNPNEQAPRAFDVYLLPVGVDQFTATPGQVTHLTVLARYPGEARAADEVRRLAGRFYPIDSVPQGTTSAIIRGITANARNAANLAERRAWENGETGDLVRATGISRPLGG